MDPAIWCTGENADHPVEEFYVGRWLKLKSSPAELPVESDTSSDRLEFSTEISKGAWMPFGGRHHSCPGRRFAKIMVVLTTGTPRVDV
jgi:cytochrome P450